MTSTLDLLQQVQKKSEERQKSLIEINQDGLDKLSKSTLESLSESENTTKNGITKSRHRITDAIKTSESSQKTQITTSGQNVVTLVQEIETETTEALNSLRKAIRAFLSHWVAVALVTFVIFIFGMLVGVSLTKLISKQDYPTYKYYLDKTNGQSYMIPLED